MQTTIQLQKETAQALQRLKEKSGAISYDALIREIIAEKKAIPKSLFGCHPKMKEFKRQENDFHDL